MHRLSTASYSYILDIYNVTYWPVNACEFGLMIEDVAIAIAIYVAYGYITAVTSYALLQSL